MELTFIGMFIILVSIPIILGGGLEAMFILMLLCGPNDEHADEGQLHAPSLSHRGMSLTSFRTYPDQMSM